MKVINEIEDEEIDDDISYNSNQDATNEKRKNSNNKKSKD
jgi:hypothetical protein